MDDASQPATSERRSIEPADLALIVALTVLVVATFTPPEFAFPASVIGILLGVRARTFGLQPWHPDSRRVVIGCLLAVVGLGLADGIIGVPDTGSLGVILRLAVAAPALWWFVTRFERNRTVTTGIGSIAALTILASAFAGLQLLSVEQGSETGIDVYLFHRSAASVLDNGGNPYRDAAVPNTSPFAEPGAVIVGYAYSPVVLHPYAGAHQLFGDPRWISLATWTGALGVLGLAAWRRSSPAALAALAILASAPVWPYTLFAAWTEPLTIFLVAASLVAWRPRPVLSAVFLGLALASKQYMVVLVPMLAFVQIPHRMRRLAIAVGVAGVTLIPWFVADPEALWASLVTAPLDIGFRPDSQSLPGFLSALGWNAELPRAVWAVVVVAAAGALGRTARTTRGVAVAMPLSLGVAFATGLAFPNYWLLVAGLTALTFVTPEDRPIETLSATASPPPGTS